RDNSITAMAPTKCFNIAGIQSAAAMAPDPVLCRRIRKALESDSVAEPNAFAVAATIASFEHCGPWLDEMRSYVFERKQTVPCFVGKNIPDLHVVPSAATYLLWLDCSAYISGFPDSEALAKEIRRKTGLFLSNGIQYGEPGRSFLRMNIACPRTLLLDGLDRLAKALSGIREAVS
ncbi:MAG: aminotransferase class I/II-fold pyridoxal phosphate-dependent enzyme, partial [Spirochaetales bacterium]|nr:aminotransferase class I/II-fold pyridoxal phosphate-dependent enzyme [Spirochaetales bacterium]